MSKGYHKRRKQIKAGTYEPHLRRAKLTGFYDSVIKQFEELLDKYESDPEFKKQVDEMNKHDQRI
jgi:ribosomal protein S4